jgi:hypothetical protein
VNDTIFGLHDLNGNVADQGAANGIGEAFVYARQLEMEDTLFFFSCELHSI